MPSIQVTKIAEDRYEVHVEDRAATVHTVTVKSEYAHKLSAGLVDSSVLVEKSFEYLLEREPNTSILRSFDLSVIAHYFPEYEKVIGKLLNK